MDRGLSEIVPGFLHQCSGQLSDWLPYLWLCARAVDCEMRIMDLAKFPLGFCPGALDGCLIGCHTSGSPMGSVCCEIWIVDLVKFPLDLCAGTPVSCLTGCCTFGSLVDPVGCEMQIMALVKCSLASCASVLDGWLVGDRVLGSEAEIQVGLKTCHPILGWFWLSLRKQIKRASIDPFLLCLTASVQRLCQKSRNTLSPANRGMAWPGGEMSVLTVGYGLWARLGCTWAPVLVSLMAI